MRTVTSGMSWLRDIYYTVQSQQYMFLIDLDLSIFVVGWCDIYSVLISISMAGWWSCWNPRQDSGTWTWSLAWRGQRTMTSLVPPSAITSESDHCHTRTIIMCCVIYIWLLVIYIYLWMLLAVSVWEMIDWGPYGS